MAKIVLTPVNNGNTLSAINSNFTKLAQELQDKVAYRNNPVGETNTVQNDLDLDGNTLFNVDEVNLQSLRIDGVEIPKADLLSIPGLTVDVSGLQSGLASTNATLSTTISTVNNNAVVEDVHNKASLRTVTGTIDPLDTVPNRANKFLVFDSNGNPISSTGTGTDSGLRADLATGPGNGKLVAPKVLQAGSFVVTTAASQPIVEQPYSVDLGGNTSNSVIRLATELTGGSGTPASGYVNSVDLTPNYLYIHCTTGHNNSTATNDGRTGIYGNRVKLIHEGQGDLVAFNASVRIRSSKPGATHWLANPAGVLINGTVIGEENGVYLNPRELYLTDKPGATAYNTTCVGDVINLNRNHITDTQANAGIGQVWAAYRAQSTGAAAVDNIISATGKFFSGIDLSMASLDLGVNKAAVALKALDRIYLNASAQAQNDGTIFIRADWRATQGFNDYIHYDSADLRIKVVVGNNPTLQVSNNQVTVSQLATTGDIIIGTGNSLFIGASKLVGGRVTGWTRVNATADKSTAFDESTGTLTQAFRRIRAIEDALHTLGGPNGLIGA